jgi:ferredoxin-fold anticodon binding domain-containing protein
MPDKLYKFRAFGVNSLRSLTEAEVFYPEPSAFNDPLDCDPSIEMDIDRAYLERLLYRMLLQRISDEKAREKVGYLRYMSSEYGDYKTDRDVEDYLKRMVTSDIKRELDLEMANKGVLSLSATWQSGLMWSHYADEHRGICIEYNTRDQEHPRLAKVDYQGQRAIKASDLYRWKVREDAAAEELVFRTYFYTKSSEWRYEREWRDVSEDNGVHSVPFRMTAILFGQRCDPSVITSIVKLLNDHPEVKIWQVLPKDESFKLRRQLVDRDEIDAFAVREPAFLAFKDIVGGDEELEELGPVEEIPAQPNEVQQ